MVWAEDLFQAGMTEEGLVTKEGLPIVIKNCEDREKGCRDPRVKLLASIKKEELQAEPEKFPMLVRLNEKHLFPEFHDLGTNVVKGIDVGMMRQMMGWSSVDQNPQVTTKEVVTEGPVRVPVRMYELPSDRTDRPCLIFFHGGGFIAGCLDVVENQCREIAALADALVISVDYRLAPENPYPAGVQDCTSVVKWTWENAGALGIDRNKIGVCGDSAGGNLAAVCALMDRDEGTHRIALQVLLYATVSRQSLTDETWYHWSPDLYENPEQDEAITNAITGIGAASNMVDLLYLEHEEQKNDPYVSPIAAADLSGMPRSLIVTAEYDFLRVENEFYAQRLHEANVPVRCVRYGGVEHAFFDKYGLLPHAMDCCKEIAAALRQG